jgi:hypothetical protein
MPIRVACEKGKAKIHLGWRQNDAETTRHPFRMQRDNRRRIRYLECGLAPIKPDTRLGWIIGLL